MQAPKIQLSATEMELIRNAEVILTKNRILEKVRRLLEEVQEAQLQVIKNNQWQDHPLFQLSPKISKGENYMGLPYLILDHPRIAQPEGLFFIRTMFWWGRFFSSTLQVSGLYKATM